MENYTKIENDIIEKLVSINLSSTELCCALILLRKTNGYQKKQDGISISQFVKLTHRSRASVIRALQNLRLLSILILVKSGKSSKSFNVYTFNKNISEWKLVSKKKLVSKMNKTSIKNEPQLVSKMIHTKENIQKKIIQKKYMSNFEEFWKLYPRKIARSKVEAKYKRLVTSKEKEEQIMNGLQRYIKKWKEEKTDTQYIPHPMTWLSQERWNDEVIISNIQFNKNAREFENEMKEKKEKEKLEYSKLRIDDGNGGLIRLSEALKKYE